MDNFDIISMVFSTLPVTISMIYPMPLPLATWAFTFWFIIKGHLTTVPHDTLSQWDYGNARGSQIGEILDDPNLCNPSILGGNVHR